MAIGPLRGRETAAPLKLTITALHPLTLATALAISDDGRAYLTDGRRYVGGYASGTEALDDRDMRRRLQFGEEIEGPVVTEVRLASGAPLPRPVSGAQGAPAARLAS